MKYTLTDRMLLLLAKYFDFYHACYSVNRALLYINRHPALHKHSLWMQRMVKNKKQKKKIYNIFSVFKRRGYLEKRKFQDSEGYILSDKAKEKITFLQITSRDKQGKKLSSGKSLMVFFDIPEKRRKSRDRFRILLQELGFKQFQKSIWITQHDVVSEIKNTIKVFRLEDYVELLIVQKVAGGEVGG